MSSTGSTPACSIEQLPVISFPLADRFYKRCGYAVSCGRLEQVYCLRAEVNGVRAIAAAVRYLPQKNYLILRNLCVDPQSRQQGFARALMQESLAHEGHQSIYCFALGCLQGFYQSLGFVCVTPEQTPREIAKRYQGYSQQHPDLVLLSRS